jgi:hypothetical protein
MHSHLKKAARGVVMLVTVFVITMGITLLVQSIIDYSNGETQDGNAFASLLLSTCLIGFPLTAFFILKTIATYRQQQTKYGMPEPPARMFLLITTSVALSIVTGLTMTMYIIYITAA